MTKVYKKTTDPVYNFLLDYGFIPKEIHHPADKIKALGSLFGLDYSVTNVSKGKSKEILRELRPHIENKDLTKATYINTVLKFLVPDAKYDIDKVYFARGRKFYQSQTWKNLRIKALSHCGSKCAACGRNPVEHNVVLHVDHILPRSIYPEYAMSISNLQVLCEDCNLGKGNTILTDFRKSKRKK